MASFRAQRPLLHSVELSEHVKMAGELKTDNSLLIKGSFSGSIKSSSHVTIDRSAAVESCTLAAASLSVSGRFSGSIAADRFVELCDRASVSAAVETKAMSVSEASRFEGRITMPGIDALRSDAPRIHDPGNDD